MRNRAVTILAIVAPIIVLAWWGLLWNFATWLLSLAIQYPHEAKIGFAAAVVSAILTAIVTRGWK